jgi:hypothetical protein
MPVVERKHREIAGVVASPVISMLVGWGMEAILLDVTSEELDTQLGIKRVPVVLHVVKLSEQSGLPSVTVLVPPMVCEPGSRVVFDCAARVQVEGSGVAFYAPYGGRVVEVAKKERAK